MSEASPLCSLSFHSHSRPQAGTDRELRASLASLVLSPFIPSLRFLSGSYSKAEKR